MTIVRDYLRLILFAAGLLTGVQVPAFVDQYQKRLDAHMLEAKQSLAGFQQTADRYFAGDVQQLIAHYRNNKDKVFQEDAHSLQQIYQRVVLLQSEWNALNGSVFARSYHMVFEHNQQILDETLSQYSYSVPLSPSALAWGICIALLLAACVESALLLIFTLLAKAKPLVWRRG